MTPEEEQAAEVRRGLIYGLSAFLIWGGLPNLFKLIHEIPALETLSWRTFFAFGFLLLLVIVRNRLGRLRAALRSRRTLATLALTSLLLALNWWVFVVAINNGQVLQVSLGYYINPLFSVLLGFFLLGERLSRLQVLAVVIAGAGVLNQTLSLGAFPWLSIGMAVLFGLYGYVRKVVKVEATEGLLIETALLMPLAVGYVIWTRMENTDVLVAGANSPFLYVGIIGVFTALPLIFFTEAARRLRLSTIGLLQYLAPTLHLVGAVWLWHEELTDVHIITFSCIWVALALYSGPSILAAIRAKS